MKKIRIAPPTTVDGAILDLRETSERLTAIAKALMVGGNVISDPMITGVLLTKSAGYLRGMAKWMEEDKEPPAAAKADPLTINDM